MRLHLCLFTDSRAPSGMGEHMLALARALRADYHLSLVCPAGPAGRRLLARARDLGVETLGLDPRGGHHEWKRLHDWLRRRPATIFHGHAGIGWEGHDGVAAACVAGAAAVVRTEHLPYLITARWQRRDHRRLIARVDRLICVSEGVRASFLAAGVPAGKLRPVRNGITPRPAAADRAGVRARLDLPPHARLVLTVGRFTRQKGHRALAEAVPAALARCPEAYFVWVGAGPLERTLRARVGALGVGDRVRFAGQCPDVPELLAAADLFVLPSLFEGLPLVVLEAMAAGLPVVGTRVCGTAEAVVDGVTGRLVDAGDAAGLAAAVVETLARPDVAARWGAAGRERVAREFSATRMARETAAIYEEVLQRGACAPEGAAASTGAGRR